MQVTWWSPRAADTTLAMDSSRYAMEARVLDHLPDDDVMLLTFMATVSMDCGCPATYTVPYEPEPNCWNRTYCGSPWHHGVKERMTASSCSAEAAPLATTPWLDGTAPWPGAMRLRGAVCCNYGNFAQRCP